MAIETEIRLKTDSLAADRARAEGEFDRLKERVEKTELRINLVFDGKKAQADFDKLLDDLQRRANARPITVPVEVKDVPGGTGGAAGMPGGAGAGTGGGGGAAGGASSATGIRGLGTIGAAYLIARSVTAALKVTNDIGDYRAAGQRGDLDAQQRSYEGIRDAAGSIPVAGPLGVQLSRFFFTGKEDDYAAKTKQETEEGEKHVKIMEHRNQLMRQAIDHSKELVRQAELESAARVRPEFRSLTNATQRLTAFDAAVDARKRNTGFAGTLDDEAAARTGLAKNVSEARTAFDAAVLSESNKQIREGQEALRKWRAEVERWNKEAERAAQVEAQRVNRLEDARAGAESFRLRSAGRGDDADRNELGRSFDKRIRAEQDAEVKHALQLEKNAAIEALNEKQRVEAAKALAENWDKAADAADKAADRIIEVQSMQSEAQELNLRNRGQGAAADFVRVRQRVRDIFASAGDDPEKQDAARQIGVGLLEQFIKGKGGAGGMFGGGVDFARSTQQAILNGGGPGREMAVEFARAFAADLKGGGNPLGEAAKAISSAAEKFKEAAEKFQPIGVIAK